MIARFKANNKFRFLGSGLSTVLGTFFLAVGFNVFLTPNDIAPGGFGGLTLVISVVMEKYFSVEISKGVLYILFNIPLYIIGTKIVGKTFFLLSLIGTASYSLFLDTVSFTIPGLSDPLLSTIYGGLFLGLGLGIVLRYGSSTGGSDMLASIITKKKPHFQTGIIVLIIDAVIVSLAALEFGLSNALYSIIAIILEGIIADRIVEGTRSIKAYYVITDKPEEIAQEVIKVMKRGVTKFEGKGMYSGDQRNMLLCLVTKNQVVALRRLVFSLDPCAFMFGSGVSEAVGNGFRHIKVGKTKQQGVKKGKVLTTFKETTNLKLPGEDER